MRALRHTRFPAPMRNCYPASLLLAIGLVVTSCAPIPTKTTAVVSVQDAPALPGFLVDFGSAELKIVNVDGKLLYGKISKLSPGQHSVCVEVLKGPTGLFGVAPFLGSCSGILDFTAEAGNEYHVACDRSKDPAELRLLDTKSGSVLAHAPCSPFGFFELPCKK